MDDYWLRLAAVCLGAAGILSGIWGVFHLMHFKQRDVTRMNDTD